MYIRLFNRLVLSSLLTIPHLARTETTALIGGRASSSAPYAAIAPPEGTLSPLPLGFIEGEIFSVALNEGGFGLVGGVSQTKAYAARISPTGACFPLAGLPADGQINNVAFNGSNHGLVGGTQLTDDAYAALVSPDLVITPIPLSFTNGAISSVALNDSNLGLIGGAKILSITPILLSRYAAYISSDIAIPISFPGLGTLDSIFSVALSDSTTGLIGGEDGGRPFACFSSLDMASQTTSFLSINLPALPGIIHSVSLANPITGLIGGELNSTAYAAFVTAGSSTPTPIAGLPKGTIFSVALNEFAQGLIGGEDSDTNLAYAAFVSPTTGAKPLTGLPIGFINSVAINRFHQGLIGGQDLSDNSAYAAIVLPTGSVTRLSLDIPNGEINSVAINSFFLSQIPTQGLGGNNLRFANYINAYAPEEAFYFIPALLDGTYSKALKSAAPTRNAISFNTAIQNTFYLATTLSTHLRNQQYVYANPTGTKSLAFADSPFKEEELLAARKIPTKKKGATTQSAPYSVWFEAIGALAHQKSQQQTPGFNPATAGASLSFDGKLNDRTTFGGGVSYLYTHVHEKHGSGSSNINQEDLFVYASWVKPYNVYFDGALWGGLFQTDQVRKIHMTGFEFTSSSHPDGWQLVPHAEVGYVVAARKTQGQEITWTPFGMVDWSNAWQESFNEKGNSPFNIHQNSRYASLLRTEVGMRLNETLFLDAWNLVFQEKASYVNTQSFGAGKVQGFLVGSPGAFTLETLTSAQHLGVVQFLMSAAPFNGNYPTSTIFYQGEFNPTYQSHQLNLEFAWNF